MIVRLTKDSAERLTLTPGQLYLVIGIEADNYRILDDHGKPYLFLSELFVAIDPHEPDDWESVIVTEGERYAYPPTLNCPGFFEDFFDGDAQAIAEFWHVVNQRLAQVA